VITHSNVAGGKWGHAPRAEGLGGVSIVQHTLFRHLKNAFFCRNLG